MHQLVEWFHGFAAGLGGPGLFLVSFLDSSFLSLPQVADILVVVTVTGHKHLMLYYAGLTTLGSTAGCYAIYALAKKGGEALLRKRFHEAHVDRAMAMYQRYGILALMVPALCPPPMPFKLFVLLAGVADVRPVQFVFAVGVARGLRFFGLGLLAIHYGDYALELMARYGKEAGLWLAGLITIGAIAFLVWRGFRAPRTGDAA